MHGGKRVKVHIMPLIKTLSLRIRLLATDGPGGVTRYHGAGPVLQKSDFSHDEELDYPLAKHHY